MSICISIQTHLDREEDTMELAELLTLVGSSWPIDENEYMGIPPHTDPTGRKLYAVNRIVLQQVSAAGRMASAMERADHGYPVNTEMLKINARKMVINAMRLVAALGMTPQEIEAEVVNWVERKKRIAKPSVHALWEGRPLCGFSLTTPSLWPAGHTFADPGDIEAITCKTCESEARCRKARGYIDVLAARRELETGSQAWLRIHTSDCGQCRLRLSQIA